MNTVDEDYGWVGAFVPHVFQQVTLGLVFKVQSGHLLHVSVFEFLRHFDLEGRKKTGPVEDVSFCEHLLCTCAAMANYSTAATLLGIQNISDPNWSHLNEIYPSKTKEMLTIWEALMGLFNSSEWLEKDSILCFRGLCWDFHARDPMKWAHIHTLMEGSNMRFVMKLRGGGIHTSTMGNPNP